MSTALQPASRAALSYLCKEWDTPDYPFPYHTVDVARGGTSCEAGWMPAPGESCAQLCIGIGRPDSRSIDVSGVPGCDPVSLSEIRLIAEALLTLVSQIESNHPALDGKALAIKEAFAEVRSGRPELVPIG